MPSPTYKLITTVTVGSGGTTFIDFTSIPQTYKHLILHCSLRGTGGNAYLSPKLRFNGATNDSSFLSRYARTLANTPGSASGTVGHIGQSSGGGSASSYYYGNITLTIANYSSTTATKAYSSLFVSPNSTSSGSALGAEMGNFTSFTAISSIRILDDNAANFEQYSEVSLYGISNA